VYIGPDESRPNRGCNGATGPLPSVMCGRFARRQNVYTSHGLHELLTCQIYLITYHILGFTTANSDIQTNSPSEKNPPIEGIFPNRKISTNSRRYSLQVHPRPSSFPQANLVGLRPSRIDQMAAL
jgi:hypothetical protein